MHLSQDPFDETLKECRDALNAIDQASTNIHEDELFELLNEMRVVVGSLDSDYHTQKVVFGLELAERSAPRIEVVFERALDVLRLHAMKYVIPDPVASGEILGVPLDRYQEIGLWIKLIEDYKTNLHKTADEEEDLDLGDLLV